MKTQLAKVVLGVIASWFITTNAYAVPVSFSDTQKQIVGSQNFNFAFNGVPQFDGGTGTFTFRADSDFCCGNSENISSWNIEGIVGETNVFHTSAGSVIHLLDDNRVDWSRSITIESAELNAVLADGIINIFVDFGSHVGSFTTNPHLDVAFAYTSASPVPESSAWMLMGTGLVGLFSYGWWKRKHQHA